MKVLIVDDSATMRMIVIKALRQAGYPQLEIIEAGGAKEALEKIAAGGIELVLSDINMPEISGLELVKVIRTKFKDLPIVMVTTESSPEMRDQMKTAGASGLIVKPFQQEELEKILGKFIK
jgi:two-component system chemotaxis response regulator CheY